jgi:hypothetical protein
VNAAELRTLDLDTIYTHLGYHEGKALAEWQAMNDG